MIRRNTASQVIYFPQLAIEGTAVTSGATLTVSKDGTESAAVGTLTHSAVDGVWKYIPTQGETDCAILGLILTKTSATPVVLNLVTTAADTNATAFGANTTMPPTVNQIQSGLATEANATANTNALGATLLAVPAAVWANGTRTLSSFGTLVADIVTAIQAYLFGAGARTITITVTDGTNPLEGALVRVASGGAQHSASTNVSGQVTFNIDDLSWTVAITKSQHSFAGATLVVNANTVPPTYVMTATTITPSDPGSITGYYTCYDENGDVEEDVDCSMYFVAWPTSSTGKAADSTLRTETSNAQGLVEFTGLFPGCQYYFKRGDEPGRKITIPADATSPYALASIVGKP